MQDRPSERRPEYDQRPPAKAGASDRTIDQRKLQIERKTFAIARKENHIGQFIRISEVGGQVCRGSIVIPESGWQEFAHLLNSMAAALHSPEPTSNSR
jgi:hypothetical protein